MACHTGAMQLDDVGDVVSALADHGYLADEGLATAIFLALRLGRPLLLEGEAGVGKTEVAKVLARWTGAELIRLQCYEGIDAAQAVYEWDYPRQLLHLRASEAAGTTGGAGVRRDDRSRTSSTASASSCADRCCRRSSGSADGPPPVLLIDEVDRADDEFEAFLLEMLSDYPVTVPELGTFRATVPPVVVITSNRTRDVHDALKRRCLYHWVEHPDFEREVAIVRLRAPEVPERLARQVAAAVEAFREARPVQAAGRRRDDRLGEGAGAARSRRARREPRCRPPSARVLKYREDQRAGPPRRSRRQLVEQPRQRSVGRREPSRSLSLVAFVRAAARRGPGRCRSGSTRRRSSRPSAPSTMSPARSVYWAGRATLVRRPEDIATYDRAFDSVLAGGAGRARPTRGSRRSPSCSTTRTGDDADREPDDELDESGRDHVLTVRFSPHEVLRQKDFAAYTTDELDEARRLMAELRLADARRRRRRRRSSPRHRGHPDLRRTVRAALRHAGRRRPAPSPGAATSVRAAWCCCSTSAARWSRTRGRCSASPTPRSPDGSGSRPSPSGPG